MFYIKKSREVRGRHRGNVNRGLGRNEEVRKEGYSW